MNGDGDNHGLITTARQAIGRAEAAEARACMAEGERDDARKQVELERNRIENLGRQMDVDAGQVGHMAASLEKAERNVDDLKAELGHILQYHADADPSDGPPLFRVYHHEHKDGGWWQWEWDGQRSGPYRTPMEAHHAAWLAITDKKLRQAERERDRFGAEASQRKLHVGRLQRRLNETRAALEARASERDRAMVERDRLNTAIEAVVCGPAALAGRKFLSCTDEIMEFLGEVRDGTWRPEATGTAFTAEDAESAEHAEDGEGKWRMYVPEARALKAERDTFEAALERITKHDGDGLVVPADGDETGPSGLMSAAAVARQALGSKGDG